MPAAIRLDRKARLALTILVVAFFGGFLLLLQSCVAALLADDPIVASSPDDDRLVFVGGHAMVLEHGSVGRRVAEWLRFGSVDTRAFEIGDQTFSRDSVELSPDGWAHLGNFTHLLKVHPGLTAQIMPSAHLTTGATLQLERRRARRLREQIVAGGILPSRVTALDKPSAAAASAAGAVPKEHSNLIVLLSK